MIDTFDEVITASVVVLANAGTSEYFNFYASLKLELVNDIPSAADCAELVVLVLILML